MHIVVNQNRGTSWKVGTRVTRLGLFWSSSLVAAFCDTESPGAVIWAHFSEVALEEDVPTLTADMLDCIPGDGDEVSPEDYAAEIEYKAER